MLSVTQDFVNLEGSKSQVEQARGFYRVLGAEGKISHFIAEGGHDFNKPMREALYGFLDRWLKRKGDGKPQPEPELDPFPEDAKELLKRRGLWDADHDFRWTITFSLHRAIVLRGGSLGAARWPDEG